MSEFRSKIMLWSFFKYKIYRQLSLSVFLSIIVIECALLVFSYSREEMRLQQQRTNIIEKYRKTNSHSMLSQPHLSKDEIKTRMIKYVFNITLLSLLIATLASLSTAYVFHLLAGHHLIKLLKANESG